MIKPVGRCRVPTPGDAGKLRRSTSPLFRGPGSSTGSSASEVAQVPPRLGHVPVGAGVSRMVPHPRPILFHVLPIQIQTGEPARKPVADTRSASLFESGTESCHAPSRDSLWAVLHLSEGVVDAAPPHFSRRSGSTAHPRRLPAMAARAWGKELLRRLNGMWATPTCGSADRGVRLRGGHPTGEVVLLAHAPPNSGEEDGQGGAQSGAVEPRLAVPVPPGESPSRRIPRRGS